MNNRLWDLIVKEVAGLLSPEEKSELTELQAQQKPVKPFARYKSKLIDAGDQVSSIE